MFKLIDYAISHARLTIATLIFLLVAGFDRFLRVGNKLFDLFTEGRLTGEEGGRVHRRRGMRQRKGQREQQQAETKYLLGHVNRFQWLDAPFRTQQVRL